MVVTTIAKARSDAAALLAISISHWGNENLKPCLKPVWPEILNRR